MSRARQERERDMDVGTKRLIVGGVIAAGLMVGGAGLVLGAGIAHAVPVGEDGAFSGPSGDQSADAYWVDLSNGTNTTGSVADAANIGHYICHQLLNGSSEGEIISNMAGGDRSQVSDIRFVVHAAEWHFCPSEY